jgi:hypothetical protein
MLELRFPASVLSEIGHAERMREIVEHIGQIRNREGNRASNQALIDHLGLMVSPRDEAAHEPLSFLFLESDGTRPRHAAADRRRTRELISKSEVDGRL